MDKYLFVDIDGCLTSIDDGNHYSCRNVESYGVCGRTVCLLKRIVSETGCRIVISSNWRRFPDDGHYVFEDIPCPNPLPRLRKELGECCIGDLPHDRHITKSEALELWFEDNGFGTHDVRFAVIDDDPGEGFMSKPKFSSNFFLCDFHHGLTEEISEKIVKHLNWKRYKVELVGNHGEDALTISECDDMESVNSAIESFRKNPENSMRYKIDPWMTVHGWRTDENGKVKKLVDFGDYGYFIEITDNG